MTKANEAENAVWPATERRQYPRVPYRIPDGVAVHIQQADGSTLKLRVHTCNISAGGILFIHGAFIDPGTRCMIGLRTFSERTTWVAGAVWRCYYAVTGAHEIGIEFDEPIHLDAFVSS